MKNFLFQKAILSRHIIISAAYYRLYLPNLLSNIDKIIYLDGDIITFDDLIVIRVLQFDIVERVHEPVPAVHIQVRIPFSVAGVVVAEHGNDRLVAQQQSVQSVEDQVFDVLRVRGAVAEIEDRVVFGLALCDALQALYNGAGARLVDRFGMDVGKNGEMELAVFGIANLVRFAAGFAEDEDGEHGNDQREHAQREITDRIHMWRLLSFFSL